MRGPFALWACSGAKIEDLYNQGQYTEKPQLDQIAMQGAQNPDVKLVSLSIGGNNAGFSEIIKECYWKRNPNNAKCTAFGNAKVKEGEEALEKGPGGNGKGLEFVLEEIHSRAPNAWIRIMLYPNLIAPIAAGGDCVIGTIAGFNIYLTSVSIEDFLGWIERLNTKIRELAKAWAAKPGVALGFTESEGLALEQPVAVVGYASTKTKPTFKNPICTPAHEAMNLISTNFGLNPESFHPTNVGYAVMGELMEKTLVAK